METQQTARLIIKQDYKLAKAPCDFYVYLNGDKTATLRNGEEQIIEVVPGTYELQIKQEKPKIAKWLTSGSKERGVRSAPLQIQVFSGQIVKISCSVIDSGLRGKLFLFSVVSVLVIYLAKLLGAPIPALVPSFSLLFMFICLATLQKKMPRKALTSLEILQLSAEYEEN